MIFTVLVWIAVLSCTIGRPQEPENSAKVVEAVNRVDAHSLPEDDWAPAQVGLEIYSGGQVRTGPASSARLELLEGMVRLWADSIFTVRQSATRQDRLVTNIFLQVGRLWAHLTLEESHEFSVETASAVAAVRDTSFSVQVAPDQTTLVSVAEGEVILTAQGESVTVAAGQQAIVKPGQPPSPPEPMNLEEIALWVSEGDMPQLAALIPTSTSTPTPTRLPTSTPTPVPTRTPVPSPTRTPTRVSPTPTSSATSSPTSTPTSTPVPTATEAPPAEVQDSTFKASDGQELVGTYYPPSACGLPLTVLYFPWVRGDRDDWEALAASLPGDFSYGVLSITTRGCEGGCGEEWDRSGWLLDYSAAIQAAQQLPCADQSRLVAMGSSVGADGAMVACAQDEKCVGALAFSANGWLGIPYVDEVGSMVEAGKHVWAVSSQGDLGVAHLDRPEWREYYREIIFPGAEHGDELYPLTGQLVQDFLECAAHSFELETCKQ
jgi:hypothetical protein